MNRFFQRLCAERRFAILFMLMGTVVFMLASAGFQLASESAPLAMLSFIGMAAGFVAQLLGLLAIMKSTRR